MSLQRIRSHNRTHTYNDSTVGLLYFQEPTTREALTWTFRLQAVSNVDGDDFDAEDKLNTELSVMLEAFISCYIPIDGEEPATELDAQTAYKLTGGWHSGTLADFIGKLIAGSLGVPEDKSEEEALEDFTVSSIE